MYQWFDIYKHKCRLQCILLASTKIQKKTAQQNSAVSVAGDHFPTASCLLFMTFHCEFRKEIPRLSHKNQSVYMNVSPIETPIHEGPPSVAQSIFTLFVTVQGTGTSGKVCFHQTTFNFFFLSPFLNLIILYFEFIWVCFSAKAKIKIEIFKV